ncbi:MAG: spore coat associated protein CotJA [Bacteroides sp.]|nr:spore coat associated protein CotJA [Eubacterium sp.]MCM1417730.1 spore coat associated protein CotJA [Roseburia sp.]MCM1461379.1 spore coat associated protein CotJA [Bacteroides sp.]
MINPNENETCREPRVGYAYVPVQRIGKVYSPSAALQNGTVFPELNITIEEYERGIWNGK